jgi:hypothetical protein
MLFSVRIGPDLHYPAFPHNKGALFFFGGPLAASQGRAARLRAAQRKTGKLARLSQTLYREDRSRTLVGEGKWGIFGDRKSRGVARNGSGRQRNRTVPHERHFIP